MKQKVLIITHSEDNPSTTLVANYLEEWGAEVVRFDVDTYPLQTSVSSAYWGGQWHVYIQTETKRYTISDITACWYRRGYNLGKGLEQLLEKKFIGSVMGEIQHTIWGMVESFPCYQFGRVSAYRRMDSKEEQLKIASKIGLRIPQTLITNEPEEVKRFLEKCPNGVVAKMQTGFAIYEEGVEQVVFTNVLNADDLTKLDSLRYCPMQFQEKIEKETELRVTIVGNKIFAFEVDSQKLETASVDWRREGVKLIDDWMPCTLPESVSSNLLKLMEVYQVDYGAIDLIKGKDGEFYFLEINAAGEYFWLDKLCEGAISKQIAQVLLGKDYRRGKPAY